MKLKCTEQNDERTTFVIVDDEGGSTGTIVIQAAELESFAKQWSGAIDWQSFPPVAALQAEGSSTSYFADMPEGVEIPVAYTPNNEPPV